MLNAQSNAEESPIQTYRPGLGAEKEEVAIARGIAKILRDLRKKKQMTLQELSRLSGVSRSMLSQVETGRSIPTVVVLCKIARTFGVPVTVFLKPEPMEPPLLLSAEQTPLKISANGKCAWRSLTPDGRERKMEFFEITLRGGGIEQVEPHPEGVWANLTLCEGMVFVALNGYRHRLKEGDVFAFYPSIPHSYVNPGNDNARLYLVLRYPETPI
ncbi:MAG: XRE family transcriptional regulator [Methylococcaceae bacterium]|nr:XRE family transcriptional regulator [Methylococcaceae bacterium]